MNDKRQPAYRAISNSIRRDIMSRRLRPGDRLPVETELAAHFGVGRSTIREVIRDLATQNLVETTRGATGGTFVVVPEPEAVSRSLGVSLSVLASNDDVSVAQMLEARELLEVPMARYACERATDEEIEAVCQHAELELTNTRIGEPNARPWGFHELIADAAHNPLLHMMCEPVRYVLWTGFGSVTESAEQARQIEEQHRQIAEALRNRDADACGEAMRDHLRYQQGFFRRIDQRLVSPD